MGTLQGDKTNPVLDKNGPFRISRKPEVGYYSYSAHREILHQNHWDPNYLSEENKNDLIEKCLNYTRSNIKPKNYNPLKLMELATLAVRPNDFLEIALPPFNQMYRFRAAPDGYAVDDDGLSASWAIANFVLENASYPWVIAGGSACALWSKSRKFTDIDMFTIIPLTDQAMWQETLMSELKWLILGDCKKTGRNNYFKRIPTLNLEMKFSGYECTHYGMGTHIAMVWSLTFWKEKYLNESKHHSIDFIMLIDDRPIWKSNVPQLNLENSKAFGEHFDGLYLHFPMKYLTEGIDYGHQGFKQRRGVMIDFAVNNNLLNTLRNPYRLLARVVETFDIEQCRTGVVKQYSNNKLLLVYLGQKPYTKITPETADEIENLISWNRKWYFVEDETLNNLKLELRTQEDSQQFKPSLINSTLPLDNISVEFEDEEFFVIIKRLRRLMKYHKRFNEKEKQDFDIASQLSLDFYANLMDEN